jgi:hypothetical protein
MYANYQREYENFTHLPGESIDALFQRFTVVVNNMRANVDVLPYDDHDRAVKLLHSLDRTIWGGKFEAIVESEKYDTLTVNELFSKLKSAEVDRGMTAKLEGPTDSHSLALVGDSKGKTNTNPSTRMFSLSSLMSVGDSPRGPLKQWGNPHLKPTKRPKHKSSNHVGNSPHHRDSDGPSRWPT